MLAGTRQAEVAGSCGDTIIVTGACTPAHVVGYSLWLLIAIASQQASVLACSRKTEVAGSCTHTVIVNRARTAAHVVFYSFWFLIAITV